MMTKIAEFTVKREKLDECLRAIETFVRAVRASEPDTLVYASYQKPDEVSFIHFMTFRDEAAEAHHRETPHVKAFVEVLYPNCEREPVFTDLRAVE